MLLGNVTDGQNLSLIV